jgi:hypothetical protein
MIGSSFFNAVAAPARSASIASMSRLLATRRLKFFWQTSSGSAAKTYLGLRQTFSTARSLIAAQLLPRIA